MRVEGSEGIDFGFSLRKNNELLIFIRKPNL
jgi:hypothetical protein